MVARFVRDEEAVGSNPATPTGNRRDRLVPAIFFAQPSVGSPPDLGYRTKRVGFMVTFRLVGAEKSVLKLVGANLKDGQNVLVL